MLGQVCNFTAYLTTTTLTNIKRLKPYFIMKRKNNTGRSSIRVHIVYVVKKMHISLNSNISNLAIKADPFLKYDFYKTGLRRTTRMIDLGT
jgi:hypothetical protein